MDVTISGLEDLQRDLARLPGVTKAAVAGAVTKTADAIAAAARERAPVRTGRLRAAIRARVVVDQTQQLRARVDIDDPVAAKYALPVEFGTQHMAAQPYLGPAADGQRGGYVQRVEDAGRQIESEMNR